MHCGLCQSQYVLPPVGGADERSYFLCTNCLLIGAAPEHFPDRRAEKDRYLTHQNGIQHEGYVKFLHQAIGPALAFIREGMSGLDYGCGPAPTLSALLRRKGHSCEDYDPFFSGHTLKKSFDFIFSTEVFEHFFFPGREIAKIRSLLEANGLLIIMTEQWKDPEHFSQWHYTRDPTHVAFYHSKTFDFICGSYGFSKIFDDNGRVVILRKGDK
jgi:SAM-dependent methyltransferase